jgi:ABC-type multidrug transport system ATPase subunit
MFRIELEGVGKRYRREWIFRDLDLELNTPDTWALLGHNGSGKSTLLRVLSGHLTPSKGTLTYWQDTNRIPDDLRYRQVSLAAPYVDLIEEFTLPEAIRFHQRFKSFRNGLDEQGLSELLQLPGARTKEIRHFSSGMKQRLKLVLAFASDTPLLLLDEPTTNLDRQGVAWYESLVEQFSADRLVVVASNVEADVAFCKHRLEITDYKPQKKSKGV